MKKSEVVYGFELHGNNGGNYLKIGRFKDSNDNRLFVEVGDCCVVTFSGYITVEAFTAFLSKVTLDNNKDLHDICIESMKWDKEVNKRFAKGCEQLSFFDRPYFEVLKEH
jgi:hypothetical protein